MREVLHSQKQKTGSRTMSTEQKTKVLVPKETHTLYKRSEQEIDLSNNSVNNVGLA